MKRQIVTETKVWELVDLPKGRYTIKGRWFSAVESDDCKTARFVTHLYIHTDLRNRLWRNFLSSHKSWNNSTSFVTSNASRLGNRSTRCQNRLSIPLASWMKKSIMDQPKVFSQYRVRRKRSIDWKMSNYGQQQSALLRNRQLHKNFFGDETSVIHRPKSFFGFNLEMRFLLQTDPDTSSFRSLVKKSSLFSFMLMILFLLWIVTTDPLS